MGFLSLVCNSFGCSASGERLVSAARDGDLQEARALLEYNPRLARYSTFGGRNSPLHYAAAQGHHWIVSLLLESGVEINLRNYRGQTALMQACQYGHWEVVQTLMLFNANVHMTDYLNGGTALHFAALHGHARCLRLVLADYVPSTLNFCTFINHRSSKEDSAADFDHDALDKMVNQKADGGVTPLHMAALNRHVECVQLLLDLGASISEATIEDGTTIDLIGAGSTPLHYAACGGNAVCCQLLIARGACITAQNASGWTPLMVARSWQRNSVEEILSNEQEGRIHTLPSPYLCLPLMSIMSIARECGWSYLNPSPVCIDPCAVCLEGSCSVAAEGCKHEFCTRCALYLCSTSYTSVNPAGAIPCPLCRHPIISFVTLAGTSPIREPPRNSLSLSFCTTCPAVNCDSTPSITAHLYRTEFQCGCMAPMGSSSFRSLSCQRMPAMKLNPSFCMGAMDTNPCLIRCSRFGSSLRRSASQGETRRRAWSLTFNPIVATGS
ncbi:probable E3 ubiquitin-protein ligase XBOS32 [Phragmites australis]|uniref:probable E3 ubiquitin-protein ligase XBOS32 n=1 Tax=Phragmites australis TaxID=29695 RepID=UPI002D77BB84|nr:probable E3 ubiquitin-protein ligase XBOS32 [Phragmites australis]XP_062221738.1 probable E3 ubiquitin-protein ligase XBOS32 [Phragmites australis]